MLGRSRRRPRRSNPGSKANGGTANQPPRKAPEMLVNSATIAQHRVGLPGLSDNMRKLAQTRPTMEKDIGTRRIATSPDQQFIQPGARPSWPQRLPNWLCFRLPQPSKCPHRGHQTVNRCGLARTRNPQVQACCSQDGRAPLLRTYGCGSGRSSVLEPAWAAVACKPV